MIKKIILIVLLSFVIIQAQDIEEDFGQDIYVQETVKIQQTQPQQIKSQEKIIENTNVQPRTFFAPGPLFTVQKLSKYRYQLVGVAMIFVYIICYLKGKRSNADLIDGFYQETQNYFNQNFAHIGFTKQRNAEPFIGESASQVIYYASGRSNIEYMQINFNMRKRQDLISLVFYQMIWPQKDMITFDIPVKSDVPLVLLLSLKKKMKTYIQKHLDIQMLTGTFQVKNLNNNYQILGESADTVDQIFDGYTVKRISDNSGLFMFMHYTDQKMFSDHTGHLRVILNGAYKDKTKYLTAVQVIFHIVDKIASLKLSQNNKAKALQARQVFNASKQKANLESHREKLRKQKEEKLRKQQAWLKSLPADKQKRQDQKRKKKQLNKMMKGKSMKAM